MEAHAAVTVGEYTVTMDILVTLAPTVMVESLYKCHEELAQFESYPSLAWSRKGAWVKQ